MVDDTPEEWKDIPGFNGRYQASTHGRIKAVGHPRRINHTFIMKPQKRGEYNYLGIGLWDATTGKARSHFVHLLILLTFVGPRPAGMQGNHKDCNKHNNRVSNLEYVTRSQNMQHAYANGRIRRVHLGYTLAPEQVRAIKELLARFSQKEMNNRRIAKMFNTSHETIRQIRLGRRWHYLT
jgi:hypothetical protein